MLAIWLFLSAPLLALGLDVREARPWLFKVAITESAIQGIIVVWAAVLDSGGSSLIAPSIVLLPAFLLVALAQIVTLVAVLVLRRQDAGREPREDSGARNEPS